MKYETVLNALIIAQKRTLLTYNKKPFRQAKKFREWLIRRNEMLEYRIFRNYEAHHFVARTINTAMKTLHDELPKRYPELFDANERR